MTTVALVPVQRLETAKSRLAGRLCPAARRELVLALLERVLGALAGAERVDAVLVVSPDPAVLAFAAASGALPLAQPGSGLNAALKLGRSEALRRGADRLLIVLGDLPLLTPAEVDALLAHPEAVVLAPDRHERGTNLLALRPPAALPPAFGPESLRAHRLAAQQRGLPLQEYRSRATALDLDTPEDLALLGEREGLTVPHCVHPRG